MKKFIFNLSSLLLIGLLLGSCESDDNGNVEPEEETNNYSLLTLIQNNSYSFNYYLQPIKNLDSQTAYTNENAVEILTETTAGVYQYGSDIYASSYSAPQSITKWSYDDTSEKFTQQGEVSTAELGYVGNICFKDETTAFIGGPSSQNIAIFNPTTMTKTGLIDFSSFARFGEVTNFPEEGSTINIEAPTEMVIRGNYLYVAFFLLNDLSTAYIPATLTADILVIDLTKVDITSTDNSDAIVKWISSDKGITVGAWNSGFGAKFMVEDEQNDLYILCHNAWGGLDYGKPNCILRIKDGETDFDPDYYFDLETASRGLGNPVLNLEYVGDGIFFGSSNDPSAINPDDPLSYYQDPIAQWYKFDLYNKTGAKVSDEYTKGSINAITYSENGKVYIPYQSITESHIKEVDIATLENTKLFTTTGSPVVRKLN